MKLISNSDDIEFVGQLEIGFTGTLLSVVAELVGQNLGRGNDFDGCTL